MTLLPGITVRRATESDLPDIARIHVAAWHESYIGIIPQAALDERTPSDRLKRWQEIYAETRDDSRCGLLIAHAGNQAAGFMRFGPGRDEGSAADFEIQAVYLLNAFKGRGAGWQLFKTSRDHALSLGHSSAYLWVLQENAPAIAAYTRWGGRIDRERIKYFEIGGASFKEFVLTFDLTAA